MLLVFELRDALSPSFSQFAALVRMATRLARDFVPFGGCGASAAELKWMGSTAGLTRALAPVYRGVAELSTKRRHEVTRSDCRRPIISARLPAISR